MHVCPPLSVAPYHALRAASSTSASARTIKASTPLSSSVLGISRSPSRAASFRPTPSEPVKWTKSTAASASFGPFSRSPATRTTRSAGNPAVASRSSSMSAVLGVCSLGFHSTALPATSACTSGTSVRKTG